MLAAGELPPVEFSRPEVAEVLIEAYRSVGHDLAVHAQRVPDRRASSALTGMGGGSLMTPILIILFGFEPTVAVGTDILHGAIFKSFGAVRHRRLGTVHGQLALWMFLGSAPMSLVGVAARHLARATTRAATRRSSLRDRRRARPRRARPRREDVHQARHQPDDAPFLLTRRDKIIAVAIGAVRLRRRPDLGRQRHVLRARDAARLPADAPKIVGTDIFHAAALLWVAGIGHLVARQRRPARDGAGCCRLDPRRAAREPDDAQSPRARRCASRSPSCSC